jgi:hypothetical protein
MPSVAMLSIAMPWFILPIVIMLNIIMLFFIMPRAVIPSVVMLCFVAPTSHNLIKNFFYSLLARVTWHCSDQDMEGSKHIMQASICWIVDDQRS